jgi:hypothetical protein
MQDAYDSSSFPEGVIPFPLHRRLRAPPNPIGLRPVLQDERFVYDVRRWPPGFAVTFKGTAITRHDTLEASVENARLIAANFWALGRRTLVRSIDDNDAITIISSFG